MHGLSHGTGHASLGHTPASQNVTASAGAYTPAPTQLAQQPPNSSAISCAQAMWSLTDSRWHCREVQLRVDQLTSSRYCERESLLPTSSAAARSKCITAGEKPPKVSKRRSRTSTPLAMADE